jgi:hypothetical protein
LFGDKQTVSGSTTQSKLLFTGYKKDAFGKVVGYSLWLTSMVCGMIFIILILDYYRMFSAASEQLVFLDHSNLSEVFVIFWHMGLLWFLGLYFCAPSLKTIPVSVKRAKFIQVSKRIEEAIKQPGMGKLVEWVHQLEVPLRRNAATVEYVDAKPPYFVYECVRYVYDRATETFEPYKFEIGQHGIELQGMSQGLTTMEAEERLVYNGPNQILFDMETFSAMIIDEFTAINYLYQFMILLIWWLILGLGTTGAGTAKGQLVRDMLFLGLVRNVCYFSDHVSLNTRGAGYWTEYFCLKACS